MILRILILLLFNFSLNAQYSLIKEFNTNIDNIIGGWPTNDVFQDNDWLYTTTDNSLVKFKSDGTQFQKVTSIGCAIRATMIIKDSFYYYVSKMNTLNKYNKYTKVVSVVYTFDDFANKCGSNSMGYIAFDGTFFYITLSEGGVHYMGTLIKIKPDGTGYQKLFDFQNSTGGTPFGGVILDSGYLYGMTRTAGNIDVGGSIYRIKTDGTSFDTLKTFYYLDGRYPHGKLLLHKNNLYGMTRNDGPKSGGTLFKIDKNGQNYQILFIFDIDSNHGTDPLTELIAYGNKFYGMTYAGGMFSPGSIGGTLFSIHIDGTNYKVLHHFNNPSSPQSAVYRLNDELYGSLSSGTGTSKDGGIFKFKLNCQSSGTANISLKNGDTFRLNNKVFYIPGTYTENIVNRAGCDSILNFTLSKCIVNKAINLEIKLGDTIVWNQNKYYLAGNYFDTISVKGSCDSLFQLNFSFCRDTIKSKIVGLKSGDSIKLGTKYYKNAGIFYDTFYIGQCREINKYTISVCSDIIVKKQQTITYGSAYTVEKSTYIKSGIYYDTFLGSNLCDSIIITDLKVVKNCKDVKVVMIKTIHKGDTVKVGKNAYTISGNFIDTIVTSFGCDSIILTYIVLNPNTSGIYKYINENVYFSYISNLNQIYISNNISNNLIIKFIDINGKVILEKIIFNSEEYIDLSFLSKGIYFVEINHNNSQLIKIEKISIQ